MNERREIIYCPACGRDTLHVQTSLGRDGRGNVSLWRCTCCRRTRHISADELAVLRWEAVRRVC